MFRYKRHVDTRRLGQHIRDTIFFKVCVYKAPIQLVSVLVASLCVIFFFGVLTSALFGRCSTEMNSAGVGVLHNAVFFFSFFLIN